MMHSSTNRHLWTTALQLIAVSVLLIRPAEAQGTEYAQRTAIGIKGGLPITDLFQLNNSASSLSNFTLNTPRYTVGPTFELRLPYSLAVEADGLYRRLTYVSNPFGFDTFRAATTANSWEFPVLLKRHLFQAPIHPFGDLGVSLRRVSGSTNFTNDSFQSTQEPLELIHRWSSGFVAGGGADLRFGVIHVQPEIRYTRWLRENFSSGSGAFKSNLNTTDFLLGVTFNK
jgi:opacity protein-like surface antigen